MKKQMIISMKALTKAMIVAALFIITACGGTQENSSTKTKPEPPEMDIYTASLFGNLDAVNQHIKAGTDLNKKDQYGSTPVIIAATFGKTDVAKALIEAGADVNLTNNDGSTPLHGAAFLCRVEIVKMLIDNGAEKDIKNNFNSTAYESVASPFSDVKPIYDQFSKDLGPLGLKLDYEYLESTRPEIAEMLK